MKQVIIVRNDLKMPKGKLAAQVAHASVESVFKSKKVKVDEWRSEGMKKVVVKVDNKEELFRYMKEAERNKIVTALIKDAGKTFFNKSTITCLGLGPDKDEILDKVTKDLKML